MSKRIKQGLFIAVILLLLLPFLQQQFKLMEVSALKGDYRLPEKPDLNFWNFFTGGYQDSMNTYIEQHIGFRPALVRLYNQYRYSLFGLSSAKGVITGKSGYLFEMNYIKAYYGLDFVGEETLAKDIEQTKAVHAYLRERDKHLIVILAPGKGTFFNEFIPERYRPDTAGLRNSDEYSEGLSKQGIPVIDGNKWFLAMKDTTEFALFPKSGIHWSFYGMGLVFDSVFKTMESLTGKKCIDFEMKNIQLSHKLRSPDRDLWEGMNLLFEPADYPMPYPEFHFGKPQPDYRPRVITVADSYYWQWFGNGYARQSFKSNDFWYYHRQIFSTENNVVRDKHLADILHEVDQHDFILLLQTDANMNRFGFGFIHDLYDALHRDEDAESRKQSEIKLIMQRIRNSESYMQLIREKADQRGISVDDMLRLDAEWLYNQRNNKPEAIEQE